MSDGSKNRREFLQGSLAGAAALGLTGLAGKAEAAKRDFSIGIDGWTFHREVFEGKIKQMGLFKVAREEFGVDYFNLVNNMLEVPTADYVARLVKEARQYDIRIPLIMIDSEGSFGHPKKEEREKAVRNHTKWVWIAADLGCKLIRVNWSIGEPKFEKDPAKGKELIERSTEAYRKLIDVGRANGIGIIIENHGGPSSYPDMLIALMRSVNSPDFGTLPDFGNFPDDVDRYDAVDRMMPYARAVSAKCHDFGPDGNETKTDFERMIQICVDKNSYHGVIGVEYEGSRLTEREGMKAGRDLLLKLKG